MKREKKSIYTIIILSVWTIVIALLPFVLTKINDNELKENSAYISSDFDIENYNIVLDVDKDNKMDITEQITVNIPENGNFNGIYKSIPLWEKYYNDDKEVLNKVKITNLRAVGEKFVLNSAKDNIDIRIGSTRTKIESGLHTYTIKYRYNIGIDTNKKFDELYFKFFENHDNTTIKKMSITINMPKTINENNIMFFNGKEDITNKVKYNITENNISAIIDTNLLKESIAVKLKLPEGYFVGGTYNYGYKCMFICIILIISSLISGILWKNYGRDMKKRCQTVEFYPPDDLDCSQIGYIYGENSIKKLTSGLIIELASKGYISIEDIGNKKYKLINTGKDNNKLKKLSINEQNVYLELFKNGDINILSEDKSFTRVFGKIKSTLESMINKRVNDIKSKKIKNITTILIFISIVAWIVAYVYIKDLEPRFNWLYSVSFISIFVTGFFSIIMGRKTDYGEEITTRIKGFKNYLEMAEKNKIEILVEENPNYFYDILPYAYVLNVSNKWIGKFEKKNITNINLDDLDGYENNLFMIIT